MRVIIAGSRGIEDYEQVVLAVNASGWKPDVVLSGAAAGVDQLGVRWALRHGVKVESYPAEWDKWGKSAGFKRNLLMASKAHALIAVWDGESNGTRHMIRVADDNLLLTYIHCIREPRRISTMAYRYANFRTGFGAWIDPRKYS